MTKYRETIAITFINHFYFNVSLIKITFNNEIMSSLKNDCITITDDGHVELYSRYMLHLGWICQSNMTQEPIFHWN